MLLVPESGQLVATKAGDSNHQGPTAAQLSGLFPADHVRAVSAAELERLKGTFVHQAKILSPRLLSAS